MYRKPLFITQPWQQVVLNTRGDQSIKAGKDKTLAYPDKRTY
jgi:hypothetical protein